MLKPLLTDEVLWHRLRDGDEEAFTLLFERYYGRMVAYGRSLTISLPVADCVQEVFADLWLYRHTLSETGSIPAYLLASTRKRLARLYERDRVFRRASPLDGLEFSLPFTIQEQLITDEETGEAVRQLNRLLNALPARQREALYLRYHHGLPVAEIATMLQINYQSAVNLLHRAVSQLRSAWIGDLPLLLAFFSLS